MIYALCKSGCYLFPALNNLNFLKPKFFSLNSVLFQNNCHWLLEKKWCQD